ncbi:bifunctional UDP-N-acetylglucosamine diphosphorylase/glucosamine-1-phosphate N-acetyltransferase GlmU [Spirulina subsalsa FACHB-351]|uniref:Bifunctional protein GlmU n=1 Tax=Spirulina subsalsa FACHB-351 TaxID=234711 RepID=A0ABT3L5L4_9CYAN|nr:bifunctional UDP-N-acetylglucosamine diphosphorylase/glucosamine-1-phosphate N-acetyltransferase GlmU [Spirulina subsalsa]MCW6036778.1 bifunctional UDP-N-acetylglucosamine diphosphorylase/glucosamine-1-phosphate N-acetyltransferase GlmU [Spirulina subsalsa FACHB-351]
MVAVAILAAGRGTRMKSDLPKVLHRLGSKTLVERVLQSCETSQPVRRLVIIGYGGEQVQASLAHYEGVEFVEQREQLGTGHAIQQLLSPLADYQGDILILNGDVPLLRPETLEKLVNTHRHFGNGATLLTAQLADPRGYGRVFCDGENYVQEIIEDRDCSAEQKQNRRINGGVYCFNWPKLAAILPHLTADNDQQEYYLTDVFSQLDQVMALDVEDEQEILGINDRQQLAIAYSILQDRIKTAWMKAGVTLIDPNSITIDDTVALEPDVIIEPQTHLRGNTKISRGSRIGPGSLIENSQIGEQVTVFYSVITDSSVATGTRVGPYTHLRGHVTVGESCRLGNFVELKKTTLGQGTNVAHLSYLGDATLGERVNIGAGTITANYDGVNKHQTKIGDRTKTGSNSVLVAPLTLGEDVTVAAGSIVTEDVEPDSLVIARSRQVVKKGWRLGH